MFGSIIVQEEKEKNGSLNPLIFTYFNLPRNYLISPFLILHKYVLLFVFFFLS